MKLVLLASYLFQQIWDEFPAVTRWYREFYEVELRRSLAAVVKGTNAILQIGHFEFKKVYTVDKRKWFQTIWSTMWHNGRSNTSLWQTSAHHINHDSTCLLVTDGTPWILLWLKALMGLEWEPMRMQWGGVVKNPRSCLWRSKMMREKRFALFMSILGLNTVWGGLLPL